MADDIDMMEEGLLEEIDQPPADDDGMDFFNFDNPTMEEEEGGTSRNSENNNNNRRRRQNQRREV